MTSVLQGPKAKAVPGGTKISNNLKVYGQVVIGPPGSGKTSYCHKMREYLSNKFGPENVKVVNLDPGNDILPYEVDVDVSDLITVSDVMDRLQLGPNGALLYCMDFIEENVDDFLIKRIETAVENACTKQPCWILFDMPGQIELFTHMESVKKIVHKLDRLMSICTLNIMDSHYCSEPGKYISCLLTSLAMMMHISTPHINILSKVDLAEKYGKLLFSLDYYSEVLDLSYLVDVLNEDPRMKKYAALNSAVADVVERYGLVSFYPFDIQNEALVEKAAKLVDRAVGRVMTL